MVPLLICIREGFINWKKRLVDVRNMKPAEKLEGCSRKRILYFKERYFGVWVGARRHECGMCKTINCLPDMEHWDL